MKKIQFKHFAYSAISSIAVLLAACSGGESANNTPSTLSVVAFGDSLTDGGTYANGIIGMNGTTPFTIKNAYSGGKFTTNKYEDVLDEQGVVIGQVNTAKTWAEVVAEGLGTSASFGPAAAEGFSQGYTVNMDMLNYAQGGSKVTVTNNNAETSASEISVTTQLDRYLTAYPKGFNARQVVMVNAGANDIFQAGGSATVVVTAAKELAVLAKTMQKDHGAVRLVIANLPDMGLTPGARAQGAQTAAGLTQLSQLYNSTLKTDLDNLGVDYLWLDVFTWFRGVIANPAANQLTNVTSTACNLGLLPGGWATGSSLFCSSNTLVTSGADMTYAFADYVHPSTKMHQLFGDFALSAIRAKNW